jgi:GT2 family glycosyltransferase/Flp pilus assembly protein TadD
MNKYVIAAPSFVPNSGGIIVLHRLCHLLNEVGQEAYIWPLLTSNKKNFNLNPDYKTTIADPNLLKEDPIIVYPEIVTGNPLKGRTVVRWLLNLPGVIGGDGIYDKEDLIFYFSKYFAQESDSENILTILGLPDNFFDIFQDYGHKRFGSCYAIHKGDRKKIQHNLEVSQEIVDFTPSKELAAIFNVKRIFYSYDAATFVSSMAALCGCISIVIPDKEVDEVKWREQWPYGIGFGINDADHAVSTMHLVKPRIEGVMADSCKQLERFIEITQEKAKTESLSSKARSSSVVAKFVSPITSIIILTYNQLEYTKKCLESIAANTPEPHEIIIVDNGSTDGTVEFLDLEAGRNKSRIKIIKNEENLGFALGNNKGIAEAKGDYVVLMNNDVVVTPGWLKRLVEVTQRKPQIGIVGPMSNYVSGPQLVKEVSYQKTSLKGLKKFSQAFARKHEGETMPYWRVVGFCMLIKREVIDKIGGLDGRFGLGNFEDDDFSLRAALAGFESWIVKDCFVHHFGSRTFAGAKIDFRESLHKNWEIFKEKWGIPADVAYGASYDMGAVVRNGFMPEKHYCPLSDKEYTSSYLNKEQEDTDATKKMYEDAQLLVQKGMNNAAIMALVKLLESYPDFALAHNDLGVLYYKAGKKEDAFEHYKKAAEFQPENINFQKNLADFYYVELGKVEEAMEIYVKILALNPQDIECLLMLGHISVSIEKIDDAKVFYMKVLESDPDNAVARQNLDSIQNYEQGTAV